MHLSIALMSSSYSPVFWLSLYVHCIIICKTNLVYLDNYPLGISLNNCCIFIQLFLFIGFLGLYRCLKTQDVKKVPKSQFKLQFYNSILSLKCKLFKRYSIKLKIKIKPSNQIKPNQTKPNHTIPYHTIP